MAMKSAALRHHAGREIRTVVVEAAARRAVAAQRSAEGEEPEQRLHRTREETDHRHPPVAGSAPPLRHARRLEAIDQSRDFARE
jgi:hypothetical protein